MGRVIKYLVFLVVLALVNTVSATELLNQEELVVGDIVYIKHCNDDFSISCIKDSELEVVKDFNGCNIIAFDSKKLDCSIPFLYSNSSELFEIPILNTLSPLKTALQNKSTDPVELSVQIRVAASMGEKYDLMLDDLKELRDDSFKCWPQGACNLKTTIDILYNLDQAGINRSKRVYHDGLFWVESKINDKTNYGWQGSIKADLNTSCTLKKSADSVSINIENNHTKIISFDYTVNDYINLTCTDDFCFGIYDEFGNELFSDCQDPGGNLSFIMKGPCWSADVETCSPSLTTKALVLNGLNKDIYSDAKGWVTDELISAEVGGKRLKSSSSLYLNLFAYNITQDKDLKSWILFSQENDGSFDSSPLLTLEANRILQGNSNEEFFIDSNEWLNSIRDSEGFNDFVADSLFHSQFKKNNYINYYPLIISADDGKGLLTVLGNANISINDSRLTINITSVKNISSVIINSVSDGKFEGFIDIFSNYGYKIPYFISKDSFLEITPQKEYFITEQVGTLDIPFKKSISNFSCAFRWSDIFSPLNVTLSDQDKLWFDFKFNKELTKTVISAYECQTPTGNLSGSFEFKVTFHNGPPILIKLDKSNITDEPASLEIRNDLNEPVNVSLKWKLDTDIYPLPDFVEIPAKKSQKVIIYQKKPILENKSEKNEIQILAAGYATAAPLIINLDDSPHDISSFPWFMVLSVAAALILFIGGSGLVVTKYRQKDVNKPNSNDKSNDNNPNVILTSNTPVQKTNMGLIEVLIAIERSMNKNDEEIKEELLSKGHSSDEIDLALSGLNSEQEQNK